jgi:phage terminase large subunit
VFSQLSIDNATKIQYNPSQINPNAKKSFGVDAGFGRSNFAIVVTQYVDGKIQVIFAEEYERPNFAAMINRIWEIKQQCGYISNIHIEDRMIVVPVPFSVEGAHMLQHAKWLMEETDEMKEL